ncbi:hypothetical protein OC842_003774 [Tilletia horrida]|uniref:histone acetyltransferase n=1 Tax=Tilletia horrida TaxID=155126 RepID=A0AAN6GAU9_9BASI|nr:hypothetical protein OC842_003774 [Tilletia horrida]
MAYRIGCKGPKACKDSGDANKIPKGALRLGSVVDIQGNTTFMWRHWGCVTDTVCSHLQEKIGEATDLDGYEDLRDEDKERVDYVFKHGTLPEAEITPAVREEALRKEQEKEEKAAAKQKAKEEKAAARKTASAQKRKKKAAPADDEDDAENEGAEEEEQDVKPPPKKRGRASKAKKEDDDDSEAAPSSSAPSTSSKRGRRTQAKKSYKEEDDDDDEFDASSASDTSFHASSYAGSPSPPPSDQPPNGAPHHFTPPPPPPRIPLRPPELNFNHNFTSSEMIDSMPLLGPHAPAPTYNAASLISYLRESLASSPLASGYRGLNGQLRIHAIFSTPRPARDLFPLAHLDLAKSSSAAGMRPPVDAYLEHILVTASFAPNHPSHAPTVQQASNANNRDLGSYPSTSSDSTAGHQMTLALECFLYTIPAHRSAVLYVSKLDSTGLGPSLPQSGHVPFISDGVDQVLDGQVLASEGNAQPSTSLTRAVTTAFVSYFASFQHWLPIKPIASSTYQAPFPFPPRLEKSLAARREALIHSPIRHLSVHVLARAQQCYLFPDSNLNPAKRVLSDGGLIRWWRRTLSDAIFATRFEHTRVLQESKGSASDYSKLTILPYYLIPGYNKYESHPIVPLPIASTNPNAPVNETPSAAIPRKANTKTELHPFWPVPPPGSSTYSSSSLNGCRAVDVNEDGSRGVLNRSFLSPTHVRSISPMWEKLGKLDERSSLAEANWTYGHPYSPEGTGIQDPAMYPILPLYHSAGRSGSNRPANDYDSQAASRGWRSIATLLPHFEDDPKSRFVDEIARDAHEHAGSGLMRAARAQSAKGKAPAGSTSSSSRHSPAGDRPPSIGNAAAAANAKGANANPKGNLALSKSHDQAEKTQKVINAAADAAGAPVKVGDRPPEGIQSASEPGPSSEASASTTTAANAAAATLRKSATFRNQLVERAALDNISPNEFWERMGFRQECCSGNAVGVFVVLFTLEPPLASINDPSKAKFPPARPPAAQPLSVPHPSIPDMVLRNIMRDACDWSNGPSAEKLTQAWGEAVHKIVMRKGNVRKYLTTGHGGGDTSSTNVASGMISDAAAAEADKSKRGTPTSGAESAAAAAKQAIWPVRSSMRIASRESNAPSPILSNGSTGVGGGLRRSTSQTEISLEGRRASGSSLARKPSMSSSSAAARGKSATEQQEEQQQQQQDRAASAPPESASVTLQDAPSDEPTWIGYNTIWTTVALHGPPRPVVARADAKLKASLTAVDNGARRALVGAQGETGGERGAGASSSGSVVGMKRAAPDGATEGSGSGPGEAAFRPSQPVTMLTVKKKKKPNP